MTPARAGRGVIHRVQRASDSIRSAILRAMASARPASAGRYFFSPAFSVGSSAGLTQFRSKGPMPLTCITVSSLM